MKFPDGIVIEESYVLSISIVPYCLRLEMDFVLASGHPLYCQPPSGERECFRRGTIAIEQFRSVTWLATGFAPSTDASGEADFGSLDEIVHDDDAWKISGDWGTIAIGGGRLLLNFSK